MDDDISGLPSTNRKLHKLGKYTGLDGLWTEMNIKPSMGLAPFKCPTEQPVGETRFLEKPLEEFATLVDFDFDTQDPMSTNYPMDIMQSDADSSDLTDDEGNLLIVDPEEPFI